MFTKLIKVIFLILVAIFVSKNANAEESQVEWRVLGPSFSYHANNKEAPVVKAGKVNFARDENGELYITDVAPPVREWSQSNPSLGIEKSWKSDCDVESTSRDRLFVSVLRDSHGKIGVMAGAGRSWTVAEIGSIKLEAGVAGGLWYRTIIKNASDDFQLSQFKYRLTPFIMPAITLDEKTTGIGVNIGIAPKWVGKNFSIPTTTVMIQTSFLF